MNVPAAAWKLDRISPRTYQHPADRAASAALGRIPYLDEVIRRLISLGYERALRAASLGASVRLGPDQLPGVWARHRVACNALDLERVPDLYLTQFPMAKLEWVREGDYDCIVAGEYIRIGDEFQQAGASLSDTGEQLRTWLRRERDEDDS